jgi:hypothetical protein
MRELTKSLLSLSWAMSLFGLKQMASLFDPASNASSSFEAVTRCTEEQLGPSTRPVFRAGDSLQRGFVDLTFTLLTFGAWQPGAGRGGGSRGGWSPGLGARGGCAGCAPVGSGAASDLTAQAMGAGIDLMQQGVNLAYQMVGGQVMGRASGQPAGSTGWGPVPPPVGSPSGEVI